jgi:hypothetical protein
MNSLLISSGTVLDPSRAYERRADVLIRDGRIRDEMQPRRREDAKEATKGKRKTKGL